MVEEWEEMKCYCRLLNGRLRGRNGTDLVKILQY